MHKIKVSDFFFKKFKFCAAHILKVIWSLLLITHYLFEAYYLSKFYFFKIVTNIIFIYFYLIDFISLQISLLNATIYGS